MEIVLAGLAALVAVAAVMGGIALAVAVAPTVIGALDDGLGAAVDLLCRVVGRGWDPGGARSRRQGKRRSG
jgi:hypothetical protein